MFFITKKKVKLWFFFYLQREYSKLCEWEFDFHIRKIGIVNLRFATENLPHLLGFQQLYDVHTIFRQFADKADININGFNIIQTLIDDHVEYQQLIVSGRIGPKSQRRIEDFTNKKDFILIETLSIIYND